MTTGTDNDLLIIDWGFARLSSVGSHRHPGTHSAAYLQTMSPNDDACF